VIFMVLQILGHRDPRQIQIGNRKYTEGSRLSVIFQENGTSYEKTGYLTIVDGISVLDEGNGIYNSFPEDAKINYL